MKRIKPSIRFLLASLSLVSLIASAQSQPAPASAAVMQLRYVTILVKNYDDALAWYTGVLGLEKIEDQSYGPGRRWLVVAPKGQSQSGIVLEVPHSDLSTADRIGKETTWVFTVADCQKFYEALNARGVHFIEPPKKQPWGTTQAIFEDLYGNIFVAESHALDSATNSSKQPGAQ